MKKITLLLANVLIVAGLSANDFGFGSKGSPLKVNKAQSNNELYTVDAGNMIFSLGYGAPNISKTIFNIYNSYDDYRTTGLGPVHLKFEYMMSDRFGVGLVINNVSSGVTYTDNSTGTLYNYNFSYSSTALNVRFNWHFYNQNNLDMYVGSGIGYRTNRYVFDTDDPTFTTTLGSNVFPLGFEVTAGIRYFFTDMIGAYFEVGAAKSVVQAGLAVKL